MNISITGIIVLVPSWGFLYINEVKKNGCKFNQWVLVPSWGFLYINLEECENSDDVIVLVPSWGFLYINRINTHFCFLLVIVLVPSWGFLYINTIKNMIEEMEALFSSPRGVFFILTVRSKKLLDVRI